MDGTAGVARACPAPPTRVRKLTKHPTYDLKNPNRVRSLVGAFAGNHLRFHAADGSGYALVGETIRALDSINPQVSSRMSAAFEAWRRYDPKRQALMRGELEIDAQDRRHLGEPVRGRDQDARLKS